MKTKISVANEMAGLRDFQQETARYVHDRMFGAGSASTSRFLVADEVGLSKTLVARGVIAQAIEHLRATGDKRIDIVYVASNSAIATQNVRKLAPAGVSTDRHTGRLSMLPYSIKDLGRRDVNVIALTPGTSMDLRSQGGILRERAAAFAALGTIWSRHRLRGAGIARIFAGNIGARNGQSIEQRLRSAADEFGRLPAKTARLFKRAIRDVDRLRKVEGLPDLDTELHALAPAYAAGRVTPTVSSRRARLIREIREAMSWTGVQLLEPDLVILDEFQRFRSLLAEDGDEWTSQIARALFNYEHKAFNRTTRVLLLSATPYVMHTTTAEAAAGSDVHYEDFLATYRFLAAGLPGTDSQAQEGDLRERLAQVRTTILDADVAGAEPVRAAARAVSEQLTRVMVRTERLSSTVDHNGMLKTYDDHVGAPSAKALGQYMDAATVANYLKSQRDISSQDVMEYWKSAPYTLSFLGGHAYLLSKAMKTRAIQHQPGDKLLGLLRKSRAVLPWTDVQRYRSVDPANGRMERLWDDMFDAGAHRLLWMPPACRYYEIDGRFDTERARRLTKRLVFSSWAVVPTVVSTMTSYEAERRLHGEARRAKASVTSYHTKSNKRHNPHLRFGVGVQSMSALVFVVPSPALAALGDPLEIGARLRDSGQESTWEGTLALVRGRIAAALRPHLPATRGVGAGSAAWYTLAPMLLDRAAGLSSDEYQPGLLEDWLAKDDEASPAYLRHLTTLRSWFDDVVSEDWDPATAGAAGVAAGSAVPPVPEDLEDVLALAAVAGPPSVLYRALSRHFPDVPEALRVEQAGRASWGVVSLFNSWEATRIIDAYRAPGDFWHKALEYCAEGHLQAVMDEYLAALVEWRGYNREPDREKALRSTADALASAMTLRTSVYDVMRPSTDGIQTEKLRGRFAVRFGDAQSEDSGEQRATAVSLSFNSPFWPFVLTTTSIGQEGLDFHLYCHAVSHWNLPSNPVDLEQREGRVHRYKGHAVRKNIARAVGAPSGVGEPWSELFARANKDTETTRDTEIVPYWVFVPETIPDDQLARIERHLPITPYSREASRRDPLMASVAFYRLAFGQPRQEELVRHVLNGIRDDSLRDELAQIRVDLTPPKSLRSDGSNT